MTDAHYDAYAGLTSKQLAARRWFIGYCINTDGFVLHGDGVTLAQNWYNTSAIRDGTISFVMAGWLEDNFDVLVTPGSAEAEDLLHVIAMLKRRASDELHNQD